MKFTLFFNDSEQVLAALDTLPKDNSPLGTLRRAINSYVLVAIDEMMVREKRAQFDRVRDRVLETAQPALVQEYGLAHGEEGKEK